MQVQLMRWGNSVAVRIPRKILDQARLAEGNCLDLVTNEPGSLALTSTEKRQTLAELVEGIMPENKHDETGWGTPLGKEVW